MKLIFSLLLCAFTVAAQQPKHVILMSLDGMGYQNVDKVPALEVLMKKGAHADGVTPHFPSTTSNSHAALWTGNWGDVNGITGNNMPILPRAGHTFLEHISGFYSTGLRAEPIWVTASKQGVSTLVQQATQTFPFEPQTTGDPRALLTLVNGYQGTLVAPDRFLRRHDVKDEPCVTDRASCFYWTAGPVTFHGVLRAGVLSVRADATQGQVTAKLDPPETTPPQGRELARHFSAGLYLPSVAAVTYFRLFEAAEDGSDFLIFQPRIQSLSLYDRGRTDPEAVAKLLQEAGGFIANGPDNDLSREPYPLGSPEWKGGDGSTENRYLEIVELITRQTMRHSDWLWRHYQPRLFVVYLPYPDEMEHAWTGLAAVNPHYREYMRRGFAIVNLAVEKYTTFARPDDDLLFVSDHGMAPVDRHVRINLAFQQAGMSRQAVHLRNCVLLNMADWKDGVIPLTDHAAAIKKAEDVLAAIHDPETGKPVISQFFDSGADEKRFGFGGPNGADFCFEYLPPYNGNDTMTGPVVERALIPFGSHGFLPTRPEMQAIAIGVGPNLPAGKVWTGMKSIDVAPLVTRLLGIQPPKDARKP